MNYYPHHIGDFDRATRHLTRIERSVYRDLIELYYDTEQPLTLDMSALCRKIIARSNEEATAVKQTLNEFFNKTDDGWYHARCEEEIEKYHANSTQKSAAGKASAAKRALKKQQAINGRSTGVATDVEQPSNGIATNQEPVTNNHTTTTSSPALRSEDPEAAEGEQEEFTLTPAPAKPVAQKPLANCPVQKIVDLYHECMPDNPTVKVIGKDRIAKIKVRWLEAAALKCKPFGYKTTDEGLAAWRAYFEVCSDSDFLTNKTPPSASHPNFKVDFDFLISPKGFSKALENRYH